MSSDKKHLKRLKKRKFHGNRFTQKIDLDVETTGSVEIDGDLDLDSEQSSKGQVVDQNIGLDLCKTTSRSTPETKHATPITTPPPSSSSKKLQKLYGLDLSDRDDETETDSNTYNCEDEEHATSRSSCSGYRMIDLELLISAIASNLVCRFCHQEVKMEEIERQGLGSIFQCSCFNRSCTKQSSISPDPQISINQSQSIHIHSINRRTAFAMRCLGGGHSDLQTFCGMMNLPPPVQKRFKPTYKRNNIQSC